MLLCFHVYNYIDVVQFCSKFASCHFAEKAKLRQPWVDVTENRTVGVIPTSRLWGAHFIVFAPSAENPSYATSHAFSVNPKNS